mgnify:CR=1 FL=1
MIYAWIRMTFLKFLKKKIECAKENICCIRSYISRVHFLTFFWCGHPNLQHLEKNFIILTYLLHLRIVQKRHDVFLLVFICFRSGDTKKSARVYQIRISNSEAENSRKFTRQENRNFTSK